MKDKEIIKALECCDMPTDDFCCECCFKGEDDCTGKLTRETINLINRQKAEIDDLFCKLTGVMHSVDKWLSVEELKQDEVSRAITMREKTLQIVKKRNAEIEKLNRNIELLAICKKDLPQKTTEAIKAEAVKEFAERLKERFLNLEYQANTERKTLPIVFVKDQIEWIMHEVSIETIDNLVKEMVGDTE